MTEFQPQFRSSDAIGVDENIRGIYLKKIIIDTTYRGRTLNTDGPIRYDGSPRF